MSLPIAPLGGMPIMPLQAPSTSSQSNPGGVSFQDMLLKSLEQASQMEHQGQAGIEQLLTGTGDITQVEVVSNLKEAELALKLMMQVRNKVLAAYDEIKQMRM